MTLVSSRKTLTETQAVYFRNEAYVVSGTYIPVNIGERFNKYLKYLRLLGFNILNKSNRFM